MRICIFYLALLAIQISCFAQTATYPNGISGCLARWNFCSNGPITSLADVSNNGHAGTTFNITSSPGFRSVANTAMNFNGNSSKIVIPHNPVLNPQQLTIIAVVKHQGFYSGTCQGNNIIYKSHGYVGAGCWGMYVSDGPYDNDCGQYSPNFEQLMFAEPTNSGPTYPLSNYISPNQWYFMAITYDGAFVRYYTVPMDINNHVTNVSPFLNRSFTQALGVNTYDVMIGATQNISHPYWFNGAMDEVALFNRALSQSEIQSVYDYLWKVVTINSLPSTLCPGGTFNLNYTVNTTSYFSAGNTFTAQLSDASGSFATPVNLGTVSSTTSGSIPCTIPVGTPAGSGYRIRIVSTNAACIAEDENCTTITIGNSSPTPPAISGNSPVCTGTSLNLTAASITGATYSWVGPNSFTSNVQNPTITNVTSAAAGTYTLTATVSGCTFPAATLNIVVNPIPSTPVATSNSPICAGSTLNLSTPAVAGATYNWTGPNSFTANAQNPTITNTTTAASGTYTLTTTIAGCSSAPTNLNVIVNPTPLVNATSNSPLCTGSTLNLTANAITGATYSWVGPNGFTSNAQNPTITNATVSAMGTYTLTVTNPGCSPIPVTVNATVSPIPSAPTITTNSPICAGSPLQLNANPTLPGATYNWTGPNSFVSANQNPVINNVAVTATGVYSVTVTQGGCTSPSATSSITVVAVPLFSLGSDINTCTTNSILLQPVNFTSTTASYLWSNAAITAATSVSAPGTYWLTITDNGCSHTDTINVTFTIPPIVNLGNDTSFCSGKTHMLINKNSVSSTSTYLWSNNSILSSLTISQAGTYWLRITDNGCIGTDTISINMTPVPNVNIGNDTFVCDGTPLTLNSSTQPPGSTYLWSNGSTTATTTVSQPGTYSLVVSNNGCINSASIKVIQLRPPMIDLGGDTILCLDERLTLPRLVSSGAEYQFIWSDGSTKPGFTVSKGGTYSVTISNICGKDMDTVKVDYKVCTIWFPSGFTPNGDDLNAIAKTKGNLGGIRDFRLTIFNRWGNKVFYTEDKYSGWDGTYKGAPQSTGTYYYMIQFNYNEETQLMKGDLTLIR